ncbi:L,D-transpeptidase [Salibacterium halotolerans]|uniref:L,D-transpeptidase catalytic domain n=1 Tax=Salibacterium halotolerans TaxID=1884432 RepID=A0A1I5NR24_9BACI|nr:L,D-transpeptidase [Salibacterium halotolerans]SFP24278.1 L,D-transpeptidase catalytic domain [Salibacterium halotolerans]
MTGGHTLLFMFVLSVLWPLNTAPEAGDPYIIINKSSNTLAYIHEGRIVEEYPVATGKKEELTPEGEFTVIVKAVRPYYRKKDIKGGSPDNPLGSRWIGFDADNTNGRVYGIHGTNRPSSIGGYVSNGCVRMRNQDVNELFEKVENGVDVWIESSTQSMEALAEKRGVLYDRKPFYLQEDLKKL